MCRVCTYSRKKWNFYELVNCNVTNKVSRSKGNLKEKKIMILRDNNFYYLCIQVNSFFTSADQSYSPTDRVDAAHTPGKPRTTAVTAVTRTHTQQTPPRGGEAGNLSRPANGASTEDILRPRHAHQTLYQGKVFAFITVIVRCMYYIRVITTIEYSIYLPYMAILI